MTSELDWPWSITLEKVPPLEIEKFYYLGPWVRSEKWKIQGKSVTQDHVISLIRSDRRFANKLYMTYQSKVDNYIKLEKQRVFTEMHEAEQRRKKRAEAKVKREAKKIKNLLLAKVVSLEEYKKIHKV